MLLGKIPPPFEPPSTIGLLENVFWGQCMSHNIIITWFVYDVKLESKPGAVPETLICSCLPELDFYPVLTKIYKGPATR